MTSALRDLSPEDAAFAESWGGRIGLEVIHGNREAAHRQVDWALAERVKHESAPLLDTPLVEVGVELRVANRLENQLGIVTVDDLLQSHIGQLIALPNIGPMAIVGTLQTLLKHTIKRVLELESR